MTSTKAFSRLLRSEQRQLRSRAYPISKEILTKGFHPSQVSAPKNEKDALAGESGNRRPKRKGVKLIRLDDLIPKKDVAGGRQLLFGATDATQTTNKPRNEN